MSNPRRNFLGWLGASTVLAATGSPLRAREPGGEERDDLTPVNADWDVAWVERIQGRHRAVFDSPEISEGMGLFRAVIWRDQYKQVYGTEPSDMSPVLVIRHAAIDLVMDDEYWKRFEIGKEAKLKDPATKKWYVANPIRAAAPDTPPAYTAYNLEGFLASGGIVLACNLAFREVVYRFRQADKLSREEAEKKAREHLLPGVILQPSGVFAVLRAQQAGCGYIMAS